MSTLLQFVTSDGTNFYVIQENPEYIIWDKRPPTPTDEAHKGLILEVIRLRTLAGIKP